MYTGTGPSHPGADGICGVRQDVLEHIQVQRHPARLGCPPGRVLTCRLRGRASRTALPPGCPISFAAASLARQVGGLLRPWSPEPTRTGRPRPIRRRRKRMPGTGPRGRARAGPRSARAARRPVVQRRAARGRARRCAARRRDLALRARAAAGVGGAVTCEQQQAHDALEAQRPLRVRARRPRRPLQRQPAIRHAGVTARCVCTESCSDLHAGSWSHRQPCLVPSATRPRNSNAEPTVLQHLGLLCRQLLPPSCPRTTTQQLFSLQPGERAHLTALLRHSDSGASRGALLSICFPHRWPSFTSFAQLFSCTWHRAAPCCQPLDMSVVLGCGARCLSRL